jgi:hypothetical protein
MLVDLHRCKSTIICAAQAGYQVKRPESVPDLRLRVGVVFHCWSSFVPLSLHEPLHDTRTHALPSGAENTARELGHDPMEVMP